MGNVAETIFALAALWVAARSLWGYHLEGQAERAASIEQKTILLERARTLYALTAFQSAPVLWAITIAAALKLASIALLNRPS